MKYLLLSLVIALSARAEMIDSELVNILSNSLSLSKEEASPNDKKRVIAEGLSKMTDSEKIRALALYNFNIDGENQKLKWGSGYPSIFIYRDFDIPIKDTSELKKLMRLETNPRKFYLLSLMSSQYVYNGKDDFVAENSRMLFCNDSISKEDSEYTQPFFSNISIFIYESIISNLQILESEFKPISDDESHKQKVIHLARWLKANWPGCENLEIPADVLKPKEATRPDLRSAARGSSKGTQRHTPDQPDAKVRWPWIAGALALLAATLAGLKLRQS